MATMQQTQSGIIKGLHPHTDTVDGQNLFYTTHILLSQIIRIGLQGNLCSSVHLIYLIYIREQTVEL